METAQRRLSDLKRLSGIIRNSTELHQEIDLKAIKELLDQAKQICSTEDNSLQNRKAHDGKMPSFKLTQSLHLDQSTHQISPGSQMQDEEIISLREQNIRLESTIKAMKKEILLLQDSKMQLEEQLKREMSQRLPYFQLKECLRGFICRLDITVDDAARVQFSLYDAILKFDRIVLASTISKTLQEFLIGEIREVTYGDNNTMLILCKNETAQENQQIFSILIHFKNKEELHRWDLALLANYVILTSMKKERLFEGITLQNQPGERSEKDLMRLLIVKRDEYVRVKKMISEKLIEKIKLSKEKKVKDGSRDSFEQLRNAVKQIDDEQSEDPFKADRLTHKNVQPLQERKGNTSNTSPYNTYPLSTANQLSKGSPIRPGQADQQLVRQKEQEKQIQNAKISLQHGYQFTKYSKDGFNPHDKKVFVSIDGELLCWSQRDAPSDYKSLQISKIRRIIYNSIGQGIRKHVKSPISQEHCIIEYLTKDNAFKVMELGSPDKEQIKTFAEEMRRYYESRKAANKW